MNTRTVCVCYNINMNEINLDKIQKDIMVISKTLQTFETNNLQMFTVLSFFETLKEGKSVLDIAFNAGDSTFTEPL